MSCDRCAWLARHGTAEPSNAWPHCPKCGHHHSAAIDCHQFKHMVSGPFPRRADRAQLAGVNNRRR